MIIVIESRRVRWVRQAACMAEMKISYKNVVRNPERKKNPWHRWKINVNIVLKSRT
jgi:hypothetical protein